MSTKSVAADIWSFAMAVIPIAGFTGACWTEAWGLALFLSVFLICDEIKRQSDRIVKAVTIAAIANKRLPS